MHHDKKTIEALVVAGYGILLSGMVNLLVFSMNRVVVFFAGGRDGVNRPSMASAIDEGMRHPRFVTTTIVVPSSFFATQYLK
jgi:hypothetical protein